MKLLTLGLESSCDDTSAALVDSEGRVLSMKSAHQDDLHRPFGGVVPEIASRNHTHYMLPLIEEVLNEAQVQWPDIYGIAVTNRPGLVGSLLVGVVTGKTLAFALQKKLVGVHHLEGHIHAPFLSDQKYSPNPNFSFPCLALVVSGGHTAIYHVKEFGNYELLGQTIDDAAGEAFDKFAKLANLGYPGGVLVDQNSQNGDRNAFPFPIALKHDDGYDYSFSGLKASALRLIQKMSEQEIQNSMADLCASYQGAIVDALMLKLKRASEDLGIKNIIVSGGVSANSELRNQVEAWVQEIGGQCMIPPLRYCTDNAAMIAYVGMKRFENNIFDDLKLGVSPRAQMPQNVDFHV